MPPFTWQARDPSDDELRRAVERAAASPQTAAVVWGRVQLLGDTSTTLVVREGSGWVGVGRWIDPLGRSHWYVEGVRDERPHEYAHRFIAGRVPAGPAETVPLRIVSPERVFLRDGKNLVAFCDCGAVGSPEALCWTGDRCGPCHDVAIDGRPPQPPLAIRAHPDEITGLAFTLDGKVLSAGWMQPRVWLWDPATGERSDLDAEGIPEGVVDLVALLDGETAIVGHKGRDLVWWDLDTNTELLRLRHSDEIAGLVLSPGGESLAVEGDHVPYLIDLETFDFRPWADSFSDLAFSHKGDTLYAINFEGESIYGIDLKKKEGFDTGLELGGGDEEGVSVSAFEASPRDSLLAVAEYLPTRLRLGDPEEGRWLLSFKGVSDKVASLAFSPDGRTLVSGDNRGHVSFHDVTTGKLLARFQSLGWRVGRLAFSPDGETLAVADQQGVIRLWPWRRLLWP